MSLYAAHQASQPVPYVDPTCRQPNLTPVTSMDKFIVNGTARASDTVIPDARQVIKQNFLCCSNGRKSIFQCLFDSCAWFRRKVLRCMQDETSTTKLISMLDDHFTARLMRQIAKSFAHAISEIAASHTN